MLLLDKFSFRLLTCGNRQRYTYRDVAYNARYFWSYSFPGHVVVLLLTDFPAQRRAVPTETSGASFLICFLKLLGGAVADYHRFKLEMRE
jgi:hypothetical protein